MELRLLIVLILSAASQCLGKWTEEVKKGWSISSGQEKMTDVLRSGIDQSYFDLSNVGEVKHIRKNSKFNSDDDFKEDDNFQLSRRKLVTNSLQNSDNDLDPIWKLDEGNITVNGTEVTCLNGHGSLHYTLQQKKQGFRDKIWEQPWVPGKGKFLLPFCWSGRTRNMIECLHGALLLAGILNRTLIVPLNHTIGNVHLRSSIDVNYINECFGENTAISLQSYLEKFGSPAIVSHAICVERCFSTRRFKTENGFWNGSKLSSAKPFYPNVIFSKDFQLLKHRMDGALKAKGLVETFGGIGDGILYISSVAYKRIVDAPYLRLGYPVDAPFKRTGVCSSTLSFQPPQPLIVAVKEFIKLNFPGGQFLAIHLRMADFLRVCQTHPTKCAFTLEETAHCLRKQLEKTFLQSVYMASDGSRRAISFLQQQNFKVKDLNILYADWSDPKNDIWKQKLLKEGFDIRESMVKLIFDKLVCANSLIFIGSVYSSFTRDIIRLRQGFGKGSCADDYYCGPIEKNDFSNKRVKKKAS